MSKTRNALRLLAGSLVVLLVALAAPARAQQFNGTLRGVVQDSTGAVLPGAQVSVVETSTNDTRNLTSDARGSWVLPNLKPGTYRIVVALDGFKTAAMDNVKLDVQGIRDVPRARQVRVEHDAHLSLGVDLFDRLVGEAMCEVEMVRGRE